MKEDKIKIGAVGDIFLCRNIQRICETEGYDYPFRQVVEKLRSYDILFGNLENPVSNRGIAAKQNPHVTFQAGIESVSGIKQAGFNIVSLANNHMNDYGEVAFIDTLSILKANGIFYVGAGEDEKQARNHVVFEKNNTRIAFLAYHHLFGKTIRAAKKNKSGIATLVRNQCLKDIRKAKSESDILCVSVHWGLDYYHYPSPYYIELSRKFIEAGCDVVLGHHSHVLQGYDSHNGGLIFYGLGNFIFDDPNPDTQLSVILDITISDRKIKNYRFIPVFDDGSHQIRFAEGDLKRKILEKIAILSAEYQKNHWKGRFYKDPTDNLIWKSCKSIINGGSLHHFRNFPVMLVLKRTLPLSIFKIKQHFIRKKQLKFYEEDTACN